MNKGPQCAIVLIAIMNLTIFLYALIRFKTSSQDDRRIEIIFSTENFVCILTG